MDNTIGQNVQSLLKTGAQTPTRKDVSKTSEKDAAASVQANAPHAERSVEQTDTVAISVKRVATESNEPAPQEQAAATGLLEDVRRQIQQEIANPFQSLDRIHHLDPEALANILG